MNAEPPGAALPGRSAVTVEISNGCDPAILDVRLAQLAREWDVDRAFLAGGACAGLLGVLWGALRNRLCLLLPMAIFAFTWQRVVRGTCAPVEALRRMGFRSLREIEDERTAILSLKDLRLPRARRPRARKSAG